MFLFYFGILHLFGTIQCLSVLKLAPAEYATNAFSSKTKYEKLAVVVLVLDSQNISHCCFAEDGKEMYQEV